MKFLKQIRLEAANILRSKFLLVIGIIVLALSLIIPIGSKIITSAARMNNNNDGIIVYEGAAAALPYYDSDSESITVNGVTIPQSNPMYWQISSLIDEQTNAGSNPMMFKNTGAVDLYLDLLQQEIDYYVNFAKAISSPGDYRYQLSWSGSNKLYEKFFYSYNGDDYDALYEVSNWKIGLSENAFRDKYVYIDANTRFEKIEEIESYFTKLNRILEASDFPLFVELMIEQEKANIADLESQIKTQEALIITNPSQEDSINEYITSMKKKIKNIQENTIPLWEMRLAKNIIPGDGSWQNNAIDEIENCNNQLTWTTIENEENFNKQQWMVSQYKTYANYVKTIQAQIDDLNNRIIIANRSLEADKPDMKFVPEGARYCTVNFLSYSVMVAMFAVLVGGWMISNEFQSGTIRLLLIRPRTRTKILLSKYFAALGLCLCIFVAGSLLNLVANGFLTGFADFGYPNYQVVGSTSFLMYYLPRMFACMLTILFGFSVAFLLSTVIRNTAVSIALPIIGYVGSMITMLAMQYNNNNNWLAYTPIPYVDISAFFTSNSAISYMISNGSSINLATGIVMLLILSAICVIISTITFNKRDVTN